MHQGNGLVKEGLACEDCDVFFYRLEIGAGCSKVPSGMMMGQGLWKSFNLAYFSGDLKNGCPIWCPKREENKKAA